MNPLIQLQKVSPLFVVSLVFACFALLPQARAVCQEGCLTSQNTVLGEDGLISNTFGGENTAIGWSAMYSNTTGVRNTATGASALLSNTTGSFNTAMGNAALYSNTLGVDNTAIGDTALTNNTSGLQNTAVGYRALLSNIRGSFNTAVGEAALTNSKANNNTAVGEAALYGNTGGSSNTAIGVKALLSNTTGNKNIAVGVRAGIGLTTGSYNIDIGNSGIAGESNTIRVGKPGDQTATYVAGISGATVPTGVAVIVDSSGHLGTTTSSARFKEAIKPMDKASESILALKPVTFRYKHELDPDGIPQFGLVAEDVGKVNPALVARDAEGKAYTVRYEAVNAMLLNEFLKEHRKVEELEAGMKVLTASLREQAAQIQKVSAQLEASRGAKQTVVSNP
jgi:hypothetical protein